MVMSTENDSYESDYKILQIKLACLEKEKLLEMEIEKERHERDVQLALKAVEIARKKAELARKQVELQNKQAEIRIKEAELQFEKLISEKDLQIQKLMIDLASSNTARLEIMGNLDPRGACQLFEEEVVGIHFSMPLAVKKQEWITYSKTDEAKPVLADVGLDDENVLAKTVEDFHNDLNKYVHNTFRDGKNVICSSDSFSETQWTLLKAIWKLKPYTTGTLLMEKPDGTFEVIA